MHLLGVRTSFSYHVWCSVNLFIVCGRSCDTVILCDRLYALKNLQNKWQRTLCSGIMSRPHTGLLLISYYTNIILYSDY